MPTSIEPPGSRLRWLSSFAFALLVIVAIARFTTIEIVRDPWDISPGAMPTPRGAGAATGLVLDLLSTLPALLVLIRASLDRTFVLRRQWSSVLMLAVGAWAVASVGWAADKFIAAVQASHLFSAGCVIWAASQVVRDSARLRIVAAGGFGLLLVLVAQSALYRAIDYPENVRYWQEHKSELLKEHNWAPNSFAAEQFEHKIVSGELSAFFNSPNSFAAAGVVLLFVSLGLGLQRLDDGDGLGWLALLGVAIASAVWILIEARSKTSAATPVLGAMLLAGMVLLRERIRQRPARYFWGGIGGAVLVMAAVVGHGWYHHGLFPGHFSNSLDFRWKYWVASARLFARHPLVGVGWENFGLYYLAVRLPEAAEEIKDPHNLLVRFFVELGIVGGVLAVAAMLRFLWELLLPRIEEDQIPAADARGGSTTVMGVAAIAVAGMLLSVLANIDFTQSIADVALELIRRVLYLLVLVLGIVAGTMRTPQQSEVDARPAPWVFRCTVVALLLLFVHNLIDFSLFETGILFVTALVAGAVLGWRTPASAGRWPIAAVRVVAGAAIVGWITAAVAFVGPVAVAEQSAFDGDESVRTAPVDQPIQLQSHWGQAAVDYRAALAEVPYNADYAMRAARAFAGAGDRADAQAMLAAAQRLNPMLIDADLMQANLELAGPNPDSSVVIADFDRILRRNPNDVSLRTQYAQALERFGQWSAAATQFQLALQYNAALPAGEPKRLTDEQVSTLRWHIQQDRQR